MLSTMSDSYRRGVWAELRTLLEPVAPVERALDFGSGDGWFAHALIAEGLAKDVVAIDVHKRKHTVVEPALYDGTRLPYADKSFDLVYTVDVLHHTPSPPVTLR